jgi:serine/threonine-protein kinase
MIGRYRIFGEIAAGGMATLHIARLVGPAAFSRTVAVKRLHPQFSKDPEFVAMLLDEARLAARISHPNVVSTLDVVSEEVELFLVMDYVAGESLAQLLRKAQAKKLPPPPAVVSSIIVDMLLGLQAAHEATSDQGQPLNIVHRDVSPQNLLIGTDGIGRVVDFGVAKAMFRTTTTEDGKIKGKLAYMSPEQLQGMAVDLRSDIFAAGTVLWEALVGQRLFSRPDPGATVMAIMNGKIQPPSELVEGLPKELDAVVLKALALNPDKRFASAGEMAEAVAAAMPCAGAIRVGAWVRSVANDALQERARRVAEVESHSWVQNIVAAGRSTTGEDATRTDHSASAIDVIPLLPKHRLAWKRIALAGALISAPLVWLLVRPSSTAPTMATGSSTARASAPAALPCASVAWVEPAPSSPPSATQTAAPSASTDPRKSPLPNPAKGAAVVKPPTTAPEPKEPRKNCNPPFTIDSRGEKVFKPECF